MRFDYNPLPIFLPFHASTAPDRYVFGGYGSGKSHAGCAEVIAWGLEHPGSEFMVMRKTVPALRDTTEKIFMSLLPPDFLAQCKVARAGGHLEHLTFPTGSTYYFRGCDDWKKHRSHNLAGIFWDEADEFTREDFEGMQTRLRQPTRTKEARTLGYTEPVTKHGNILASNPQGHNWLWENAVSPEKKLSGTEFFTGTSFDNPYNPAGYLERLLEMPDPWVRRYVLCSFDEFAGSIFPEWGYDTHVIAPIKNGLGKYAYDPASFFRMGMDPGTHSPTAGVWLYYDKPTHTLVAVAEYCEPGLAASKHALEWKRIEAAHGMRVQRRIADPKAIGIRDRGTNISLRDQYARLGFSFQLGPASVDDRVTSMAQLIFQGRLKATTECPRFYEQVLNYRWEDLSPLQMEKGRSAKPLKKDVDLVDAGQYGISNYVAPPKVVPKRTHEEQHTHEVHAAIRKQIRAKRKRMRQANHDLGGMSV